MAPPEPEAGEDNYDEYYDAVREAEQFQWCPVHKPAGSVPCHGGSGANM
jgi:hypothetical protein